MIFITSSVLSKQISPLYLLALLAVEAFVGLIVMEFVRGPWEGKVREAEIVMEEMNERLFESISSLHTNNEFVSGLNQMVMMMPTANLNSQGNESNAPSQFRQLRN
jgi:hypothetical protein